MPFDQDSRKVLTILTFTLVSFVSISQPDIMALLD